MTELQDLMLRNVAEPPQDELDLRDVLERGRRRAQTRRRRAVGAAGSAVLVAAVVVAVVAAGPGQRSSRPRPTGEPPVADGVTLRLSDATPAIAGRDYEVLASHTIQSLAPGDGQRFVGVTDDGKILVQEGPTADDVTSHLALVDPATGVKDRLPDPSIGQDDTVPVELGAHRLVLLSRSGAGRTGSLIGHVFDRDTGQWQTVRWPGLPDVAAPGGVIGPDGRLYVSVPATQGAVPDSGWPLGPGKEADDSGAEGDTYQVWSVSVDSSVDVRDEHLTAGSLTFTPTSMIWTDRTNGAMGLVHVRTLSTGEENSFDPHAGARCNLLGLSAWDDRVVLDEYCGTAADGTRDDRLQILSTDGDAVATLQDDGIGGGIFGLGGHDPIVTVYSLDPGRVGTYVFDLADGHFLHIAHGMSKWSLGGPAPDGEFLWQTSVNHGAGATQWLGRLLP
jgi:hypothetical protein